VNRRQRLILIGAAIVVSPIFFLRMLPEVHPPGTAATVPAPSEPSRSIAFACLGRVDQHGDPFDISAEADGVIEAVLVREGQKIRKGDMLAKIACRDRQSAIEAATAAAGSARSALQRLHRGSRDEERRAAVQATLAARTQWEHSQVLAKRYESLFQSGDIPRQTLDNAMRDLTIAQAHFRRAEQEQQLLFAPPLPEEVARLEYEVKLAESNLESARILAAKCLVHSPVNGTVVKLIRKAGESVSVSASQPILTIADLSALQVRAEVDERDVSKVSAGQNVLVRLDDQHMLPGKVDRISLRMGRKSIQSAATNDKNDRDVLDVWITVSFKGIARPLGLRVVVQFLAPGTTADPV